MSDRVGNTGKKILNPSRGISGGKKQRCEVALGQEVGVSTSAPAREALH